MFSYVIQVISTVIILIFSVRLFIKGYKDSKSDFEKILYIILSLAMMFPLLIYYLDRYNIPSKFGYTKNIISSDWVGILTNYSATLISTLLSAVFLIFVTFKQMDETYKDNIKLNNETQRIQNLPFLRYNFTHERLKEKELKENQKLIFSGQNKNNNSNLIEFTMEIENIGLNTVRKVYLEVESELLNKKEIFELCNQSNIEKGQIKSAEFIIANVSKGTYKIEIAVYYQDLLKNWYKQKIRLIISVNDIYNSMTHDQNKISSVVVVDEEMLLKEPTFVKKIEKSSIKSI